MFHLKSIKILILGIFVLFQFGSHAEVSRIEILQREQLSTAALHYSYEKIEGIVYLSLDPQDPKHQHQILIEVYNLKQIYLLNLV